MLQYLLQEQFELFVIVISLSISGANLAFLSRPGPESKLNGIIGLLLGIFGWYFTAVLFGAKLIETIQETLLFSLAMSSMTVVAPSAYLGLHVLQFKRLFIMFSVIDAKERWILGSAIGATAGAWFGVWPIPLDWERWWQAWPIPCLVGALIGYALSQVILAILSVQAFQKDNSDKVRTD